MGYISEEEMLKKRGYDPNVHDIFNLSSIWPQTWIIEKGQTQLLIASIRKVCEAFSNETEMNRSNKK